MIAPASDPCRCGCQHATGRVVHRIMAALALDDFDAAIEAGLLDDSDMTCGGCSQGCRATLLDARKTRRTALAARERFRAREGRLALRQQARSLRRDSATMQPVRAISSLPPAAAAALARARIKAAGTRDR